MKLIALVLCLVAGMAVALLLTGCHVPGSPDGPRVFIETVSREAARVGASYDLQAHPERRVAYQAAAAALQGLVDRTNYNAAEFHAILDRLPAKLTGAQGALVIDVGVSLWTVAMGWVDLDNAPNVAAAVRGTLAGLRQALAPPGGQGAARAATLPKQCVVPNRKR